MTAHSMKKLKIIISLIFLLVLSVIVGFMTAFNRKPLTPRGDYPLLFIAGTLAVILVLGFMFWGVYAFCKKQGASNPFKIAFWVYTFFWFCLFGVAAYQFDDSLEKRDNYEFMEFYADTIEVMVHDRVVEELLKHEEIEPQTVVEIHDCAFTMIGHNTDFIEPMRKARSIEAYLKTDKAVREMIDFCIKNSKEN